MTNSSDSEHYIELKLRIGNHSYSNRTEFKNVSFEKLGPILAKTVKLHDQYVILLSSIDKAVSPPSGSSGG